jgi:hypothetical protein
VQENSVQYKHRSSYGLLIWQVNGLIPNVIEHRTPVAPATAIPQWVKQDVTQRRIVVGVVKKAFWTGTPTAVADSPRVVKSVHASPDDWAAQRLNRTTQFVGEDGLPGAVNTIDGYTPYSCIRQGHN